MTEFATILKDKGIERPVLLWREDEAGRPTVASRHASIDELPEGVDVYAFDVPTTMGKGDALNSGLYPTVDADGAPLWEGARIAYCVQDYYVNTTSGEGTLKSVDRYGGSYFTSDNPLPVYVDRNGRYDEKSRNRYAGWTEFPTEGDLKGFRRLAGKLGDPFEHGQRETFLRLTDDPRDVCSLVRSNAPAGP